MCENAFLYSIESIISNSSVSLKKHLFISVQTPEIFEIIITSTNSPINPTLHNQPDKSELISWR